MMNETDLARITEAIEAWEGADNSPGPYTWDELKLSTHLNMEGLLALCSVTHEQVIALLPDDLPEDDEGLLQCVAGIGDDLWLASIFPDADKLGIETPKRGPQDGDRAMTTTMTTTQPHTWGVETPRNHWFVSGATLLEAIAANYERIIQDAMGALSIGYKLKSAILYEPTVEPVPDYDCPARDRPIRDRKLLAKLQFTVLHHTKEDFAPSYYRGGAGSPRREVITVTVRDIARDDPIADPDDAITFPFSFPISRGLGTGAG